MLYKIDPSSKDGFPSDHLHGFGRLPTCAFSIHNFSEEGMILIGPRLQSSVAVLWFGHHLFVFDFYESCLALVDGNNYSAFLPHLALFHYFLLSSVFHVVMD